MKKSSKLKPVIKWAGGKTQLKTFILSHIKKHYTYDKTYFEPFFGGGAIFFELKPENAVVNDINSEIMLMYEVIKKSPMKLMKELDKLKKNHSEEFYYEIRSIDRLDGYKQTSEVKKAARTIYLNKTCFNGLYRVNSSGYFNTPFGKHMNPNLYSEDNVLLMSEYFKNSNIEILSTDFSEAVNSACEGDVIYFDPPYDYEYEGFTQYSKIGFSRDDLSKLKKLCDDLISKGCIVLVSNNKTQFVTNLFNEKNYKTYYRTHTVEANRLINSKGNERKKVKEVLIVGKKEIDISTGK